MTEGGENAAAIVRQENIPAPLWSAHCGLERSEKTPCSSHVFLLKLKKKLFFWLQNESILNFQRVNSSLPFSVLSPEHNRTVEHRCKPRMHLCADASGEANTVENNSPNNRPAATQLSMWCQFGFLKGSSCGLMKTCFPLICGTADTLTTDPTEEMNCRQRRIWRRVFPFHN